jgi:hypothetical protein
MSVSHLDRLLVDIKVISKIEENGKIKTNGSSNISLDSKSVIRGLWRNLRGDDRNKAIDAIEEKIFAVIEISNQLIDSNYLTSRTNSSDTTEKFFKTEKEKILIALKNVSHDLQACVKGLRNLSKTYWDDAVVIARLDQIIGCIDNHVCKLDKKLSLLKDS